MRGLMVSPDFVSDIEEDYLLRFFDGAHHSRWKVSQSGRRKQDYGPRANFKKRKLKKGDGNGMPIQLKDIITRVNQFISNETMKRYQTIEVSVLEYSTKCGSSIDPHIDDTWLWGDRIGGLNLLEDVVLTLVDSKGTVATVFVPRRSFFLLSGESRYNWMHGIRSEDIKSRRISMTFREFADNLEVDERLLQDILSFSLTFV
ncbi:alpha-ketoglutarate-dependent dioxygenase alkB 4-like protein [Trypanosoma vivax]|nr:alpha-ketoglutarate-dependent dioxygenase alkB 4-like protein [Trypanosoma vivax]